MNIKLINKLEIPVFTKHYKAILAIVHFHEILKYNANGFVYNYIMLL